MKKNSNSSRGVAQIILLCLVIGVIIGILIGYFIKKPSVNTTYAVREKTNEFKFIKPLLVVENTNTAPSPQYQSLYDTIQNYIKTHSDTVDKTSEYLIDYGQDGGRFIINGSDQYYPSSLMKVVVMIAYFKKTETDPNILNTQLVYQSAIEQTLQENTFNSPTTLEVGRSYTVSELIDNMITNSDNGAMNLLIDNLGYKQLNTIYSDLGLSAPSPDGNDYTISVKDYSLFFRILYNATYLSPEMSERALSILSKATFTDGLVTGIPKDTLTAHKFGEHVFSTDGKNIDAVELHDCGIVYTSNHPYFLCIMTHGDSLDALKKIIGDISKMVYVGVVKDK